MRKRRTYYVYIMSSLSRTLYTGVTNNLERRIAEHTEQKSRLARQPRAGMTDPQLPHVNVFTGHHTR